MALWLRLFPLPRPTLPLTLTHKLLTCVLVCVCALCISPLAVLTAGQRPLGFYFEKLSFWAPLLSSEAFPGRDSRLAEGAKKQLH